MSVAEIENHYLCVYKGEKTLTFGTFSEIVDKLQVKPSTVEWYMSNAHIKRLDEQHVTNGIVIVDIDADGESAREIRTRRTRAKYKCIANYYMRHSMDETSFKFDCNVKQVSEIFKAVYGCSKRDYLKLNNIKKAG